MITFGIIGVTVVLSYMAFMNKELMMKLMFIPSVVHEYNEFQRAITHIFIHADWTHLLMNMFVLYNFGPILEHYFTEIRQPNPELHFLLLYFGAGLFATILPYARNKTNPSYMSLGASGSVSGVVFAFICLMPTAPLSIILIPISFPAYVFGILYLLYEYYMDKRGGTGIAHDAHIGGAIFGIIFMLVFHFDRVVTALSSIFGS